MQEPWEEVLRIYNAWEFSKPDWFKELENHLGVELLFVSALNNTMFMLMDKNEPDVEEKLRGLEECKQRFLEDHPDR